MTSFVTVNDTPLRVIGHPLYAVAHPGEPVDEPDAECDRCVIAERTDTGARVLLWLCGGLTWSVSRADPNYATHKAALEVQ